MDKMPGRVTMRVVLFVYILWLFGGLIAAPDRTTGSVYTVGVGVGLLGLTILAVAPPVGPTGK